MHPHYNFVFLIGFKLGLSIRTQSEGIPEAGAENMRVGGKKVTEGRK